MLRRHRSWLPTGIALVALLWAALAPTLTHALWASGLPVEVCTAAGLRVGPDTGRDTDTDTDRRSDPCALCGLSLAKAPPPPAGGLPARLARADGPAVHPDTAVPRAAGPRASAQPRAPPRRA